jgi:hypothetical protein
LKRVNEIDSIYKLDNGSVCRCSDSEEGKQCGGDNAIHGFPFGFYILCFCAGRRALSKSRNTHYDKFFEVKNKSLN